MKRLISLFLIGACASIGGFGQSRRQTASLPDGTPIEVRLASQIDSGEAKDGDTFTATLMQPLTAQGRTLASRGAQVSGRVVSAVSSGRLKRPAELTLELVQVGSYRVTTEPVTLDGKSHTGRNTALIGGGAAAGAIIGAIAGGGKGAAIGAAAGAGAGTGAAYLTGKQELVLPVEMAIRFVTPGAAGSVPGGVAAGSGSGGTSPSASAPPPPVRSSSSATTVFSDGDRRVIGDYLSSNRNSLPPGLAKRDRLPPGLERQVQRNGTLPPGLQKRVTPFPAELERQLPPVPAGHSRVFLGGRAILMDAGQKILDIFIAM